MKKFVVIIGDGMADRPIEELGYVTPLKKAHTPNMDKLAQEGIIGKVRTIPEGFHPGSDVANLSILGYDPSKYYTGRAPLEAASIGVELKENDVAYRCNLVTLAFAQDESKTIMADYSSGHISSEEARELVHALSAELGSDVMHFYPGVSYRHLLVWENGSLNAECVPPHDILEKEIGHYLPTGEGAEVLRDLMNRSVNILAQHPVNKKRVSEGRKPASSIWLWGQGKKPDLPTYPEKYGLKGALISAVDLTRGLGIYADLKILAVPGITGWLDTNYAGKAEYALKALGEFDFVYIHVEAPDEAGHSGNYRDKIKAIEDFDASVVGSLVRGLEKKFRDYRILLMPDHATPVKVRTHTSEPVPFVIFDTGIKRRNEGVAYDESITEMNDILVFEEGYTLMDYFIRGG